MNENIPYEVNSSKKYEISPESKRLGALSFGYQKNFRRLVMNEQ